MTEIKETTLTDTQRALFEACGDERELDEIIHPAWDKAKRFLTWEYYVPDYLAELWSELPLEAQFIAYVDASRDRSSDDPDCGWAGF